MSFTAGSSGGEYKHKLTLEELIPHNHAILTWPNQRWLGVWKSNASGGNLWDIVCPAPYGTDYEYAIAEKDERSKGTPFNVIQPYMTVYYWKRTA